MGVEPIAMTLHGSRRVDLRLLSGEDIRLEDIAHALANLCRFVGHVRGFYSVAQHSLLVTAMLGHDADKTLRRKALLHDATEAYLADLPRNVKHAPELQGYRRLEADLNRRIMERFSLPVEDDPRVKASDIFVGDMEWQQFMNDAPYGIHIVSWGPEQAKAEFLKTAAELEVV